MLGRERAQRALEMALAASKAEQTEAVLLAHDSSLTRFARNTIHQNVSERDATLRVRAVIGHRSGVAFGNDLSREGISGLAERALAVARLQPEDPQFPGLPGRQQYRQVRAADESTANCSPERRARLAGSLCRRCASMGLNAAGALETGLHELAIANSQGVEAYHAYTTAEITTVVMAGDSSGYGYALAGSIDGLDVEDAGQRAIEKAVRGRNPRAVPAGAYTVVLEPDAASDILGSLAYTSFGANSFEEQASFMAGHLGEPVLASSVSIKDDPLAPDTIPMPFDYEGVTCRPTIIIEKGIARGVVHDSYSAAKARTASTGHALPAPNPAGPLPTHLVLEPGAVSFSEMIAGLKRGLMITRFHYTRIVHQPTVTVTGMTRDGTFWVENGEIAYPVRNLRFTESYVAALQRPITIGRETRLCGEFGPYLVPPVLIPEFKFTGVTDF